MNLLQKVSKFTLPVMPPKRKLSKTPSVSSETQSPTKTLRVEAPKTSKYFSTESTSFAQKFINIQLELNSALKPLTFKPPVAYVYNPVEYAFKPNETYVKKYCQGPKKLLFVGMNPGPFGMCQTGVPFGEINSVRDWLQIEEEVGKPDEECPKRPVEGFNCKQSEVSGKKLWGLLKNLCGTPETFFKSCFVYNYCPLALLTKDGANKTPSDIKNDAKLLEEICDRFLFQIIELLNPEIVVGIGRYAEKRCLLALKGKDFQTKVICITHPSPRVPNNQNWPEKAQEFFRREDLLRYMIE